MDYLTSASWLGAQETHVCPPSTLPDRDACFRVLWQLFFGCWDQILSDRGVCVCIIHTYTSNYADINIGNSGVHIQDPCSKSSDLRPSPSALLLWVGDVNYPDSDLPRALCSPSLHAVWSCESVEFLLGVLLSTGHLVLLYFCGVVAIQAPDASASSEFVKNHYSPYKPSIRSTQREAGVSSFV